MLSWTLFTSKILTLNPAPILEQLDLNISLKTINGRFRDHDSPWRQPPSLEVDAAWDRISAEGIELIGISRDEITKSGKDPSVCLKIPTPWDQNAGEHPYIAQIDVFHQIHCLDMVRKEVFSEHYFKDITRTELRTAHVNHCIHIILQNLMCNADVGMITHNWVRNELYPIEPKTRPFEDFNLVKKCRDFDALLDWAQERGIKDSDNMYRHLRWEPGMKIVPGDGYGPDSEAHSASLWVGYVPRTNHDYLLV